MLPSIAGEKVTFRAGFKTAEYPLPSTTGRLNGPDEFQLACISPTGATDIFVFHSRKAQEHVFAFAENGGHVEGSYPKQDGDGRTQVADTAQAAQPVTPWPQLPSGGEVPEATVSDDAAYVWDGQAWRQASYSPDRALVSDGVSWWTVPKARQKVVKTYVKAAEAATHELAKIDEATNAASGALQRTKKIVTLQSGEAVTMVPMAELEKTITAVSSKDVGPELDGQRTADVLALLRSELERRRLVEKESGVDALFARATLESEGFDAAVSPLMLHRNEVAYFPGPAQLARYKTKTRYQGASQGVSVPLGHGFRYRVGGFRGHAVSHQELTVVDQGTLVLTNQRIAFVGGRQTVSIPVDKVSHIAALSNGLEVAKEGREAMDFYLFPSGPLFLVCFNYLLEHGSLGPLHSQPAPAASDRPADDGSTATPVAPITDSRPTSSDDIPALIRQLGELRGAGLLTDQEFDTKKQELLTRL